MKLKQLEAMRAVMSRGTTTHAAEVMGITQSAVSRLITQLEGELGFSLFDRRNRRLLITPEGRHFYDIAEKVLAGIDQISATARDIQTLRFGSVRVAAMPALAFGLLPEPVAAIKRRFQNVKISIDSAGRQDLLKGIAHARYDLGIATLPIEHELVDVEPLCSARAVCILPPEHRLAGAQVINAGDLENEQFIAVEPGASFRYRIDELFGQLAVSRSLTIEAENSVLICNLVAAGLGVAVVHPFIANDFGSRIVAKRLQPELRMDYGLLFPSGQTRSQVTQEFCTELRRYASTFDEDGEAYSGLA